MSRPSDYRPMGPVTLSEGEPSSGTECYMVPVKLYWIHVGITALGALKIIGAW
jgi:hypothetical protein